MLTYLFADIESSTLLWEDHPDEMTTALARHDSIFSEAIEHSQGKLVKSTGDGGLAVFENVGDAVAAAVATQTALAHEDWGPTGPIRVRMGIHSGDSEARDGDYYGTAVNRAARIMAAGHGGQILMSGISSQSASDSMPPGTTLRDLGTHRLKDLTVPEHLHQLIHPDLQSDFPAPLTLDSRPHNLPLQSTEFLGRSSELAAISVMLEAPNIRLLTIAGPGGAGKTRLGLQAAAEQFDRFNDGVFFTDLSMERDPDAAFEAIVRSLNLPSSGGSALEVLKTRLRDKHMLLVLDNFEQVTSAATGVGDLLQHAPGLKMMVTSRETLRIRAEYVFPVPPLSLPNPNDPFTIIGESEATQLFVERARTVRPDFYLDAENASTVAEICLRLDGLPLAIELAAARLNVFTPFDLLLRLRERLDVLGAGGRDVPDRQRTLWGAIAWSYELLNDHERHLFDLMAVFSTTLMDAIESVARDALGEFDVDSLASLVDKNLVQSDDSDGSKRFSMLLMIKEFAEERLATDVETDRKVRRAHALHFSEFAHQLEDRLAGPEREATLDDLASEIGNLRTAWRYWVDQAEVEQLFNLIGGLWAIHEARGWYHAAIELASDTLEVLATMPSTPELAAEELVIRTSLARALMAVRGYGVEVEEAYKSVLEMSESSATTAQRYPILRALWMYYMNSADIERSLEIAEEILEMSEHDDSITVDALYISGASRAFSGHLETGLAQLDKAIELYDPKLQGSSRYRLGTNVGVAARVASGILRWQCGLVVTGPEQVAEALQLARTIDHPFSIAWALYHNGFLSLGRSRFEDALRFAEELALVSEENDYVLWGILATVLEGVATTARGDLAVGLPMTEKAVELYEGLTTPPIFWPLVLSMRALVTAIAGQPERGIELIEQALEIVDPDDSFAPMFQNTRGDMLGMVPGTDPRLREAIYASAAQKSHQGGYSTTELQAMTRLVTVRREMNKTPDGSEDLAHLYGRFTEGFEEHDLVAARVVLGI